MFDYHVHTSFSADSRMPMEKACQEAVDKGIQEIAFTEHVDYFYPDSTFVWDLIMINIVPPLRSCNKHFKTN